MNETHPQATREELTARADRVREDLAGIVQKLARYRHPFRIHDPSVRLAAFGAAATVVLGAGAFVAFAVGRRLPPRRRLRQQRILLARDIWMHPGAFRRARQPPFWMRIAQSASMTFLSTALSIGAKVAVRHLATGSAAAAGGTGQAALRT
jgi:hypothetical protein